MKQPIRRVTSPTTSRKLVTTLGDLISAAFDVVPGPGRVKVERARDLLTRSPLARQMSPHVEFVR